MLEIFLLVIILSLDSFTTALTYGITGIKIPVRSGLIISAVGATALTISLFASKLIGSMMSAEMCRGISVGTLILLGIISILQNCLKEYLRKINGNKSLKFKYSGIDFVINLYLDETMADMDCSKSLSVKESLILAVALSIDSLVTGFSVGLGISNRIIAIIISFIVGTSAIMLGSFSGQKISKSKKLNISWLSGVFLIFLGILKLF